MRGSFYLSKPVRKELILDGEWTPTVPGTGVARPLFIKRLIMAHETAMVRDTARTTQLFIEVAKHRVLSAQQLSNVFGLSRQRVYIKLLQYGIGNPDPEKRWVGHINPKQLRGLLVPTRYFYDGRIEDMDISYFGFLPHSGRRTAIELLTGIDYGSYTPFRPYAKGPLRIKVS